MINIAELLKDAPKGMKLYSPLFGEVEFIGVFNDGKTIKTKAYPEFSKSFFEDGRYFSFPEAECLLFPSKDCRTWEGWKLPSKPAFKVNEWIILDRTYTIPIQIVEINQKEGIYTCKSIEGLCGNYSITQTDKNYHLWSIADANNGDIIHTPNNNLFIYKCKGKRGAQIWDYCGLYHGKFEPESSSPNGVYNSCDGYVPATKERCDLLFAKMKEAGYKWDASKKELCKIIDPQFKVGDWVVKKDGTPFYGGNYAEQITNIEDDGGLKCIWFSSGTWLRENDIRLWSHEDARDGDVLVNQNGEMPFVFKSRKDNHIYCYCAYTNHKDIFFEKFLDDGKELHWINLLHEQVQPANKEQRDLLFAKMKEAGYQWDADKKELKKISKHYDIKNFHAGMEVLVRDEDNKKWCYLLYSHYDDTCITGYCFNAGSVHWRQCIPFENNKHLLGTSDPCDERYINW